MDSAQVFLSTLSLRRATDMQLQLCRTKSKFLSTLSLRRATVGVEIDNTDYWNFYPRSPCGERHFIYVVGGRATGISIHALLAESDMFGCICLKIFVHFYPRSPCGERLNGCVTIYKGHHFYPRSPCGERHIDSVPPASRKIFLSTLSLRRATFLQCKY